MHVNYHLENVDIFEIRRNWDSAISFMNELKINKVLKEESAFTNIESYLFCFEGLIQVMVRQIKSPKLIIALVLNNTCYNSISKSTKFSPQFN